MTMNLHLKHLRGCEEIMMFLHFGLNCSFSSFKQFLL